MRKIILVLMAVLGIMAQSSEARSPSDAIFMVERTDGSTLTYRITGKVQILDTGLKEWVCLTAPGTPCFGCTPSFAYQTNRVITASTCVSCNSPNGPRKSILTLADVDSSKATIGAFCK